ncbi:MAG: nucleotidyl transferase AbiEii/AbiGii toxin family protein [Proteobacteria bacterium]|nr:nucleotidyl transferase AbiEii/AbiGii toxin family protein [Pseudomonadota bacterium]
MSADITLRELLEVQAYFGLPSPALVEKDFYVVRALAAIAAINTAPLSLVFGGGTALGRAHRLIRRMSEDIDLKVTGEKTPTRGGLRRLRETMTDALLRAGFQFDPANPEHLKMGNQNRYTVYRLPYEPLARGQGALRPEIKIEVAVWPLWRPALQLPVASFFSEARQAPAEIASIGCVSITQTAAEKFVALTRKTAAELADAVGPRDPTLARHIYDLHIIRDHFDVAEVASLALEIARQDAEVFGNQFPAYRDDPAAETRRAVEALAGDPRYVQRYAEFQRDMVYGDRPAYSDAMQTTLAIARGFQGGR